MSVAHFNPDLFKNVGELLPHTGEMMLISGVSSWGEDYVCVYVDQDGSSLFADEGGDVPVWVGIEYMAQAIGVYAGWQAKLSGHPIRLGFLLGTRKYSTYVSRFLKNSRLEVRVERELFEEGGVALFGCTIHCDGQLMAKAAVKAIQPDNIEELLKGE